MEIDKILRINRLKEKLDKDYEEFIKFVPSSEAKIFLNKYKEELNNYLNNNIIKENIINKIKK